MFRPALSLDALSQNGYGFRHFVARAIRPFRPLSLINLSKGKGTWNRGKGDRQVDSRSSRRELPKPPIWAAVEQGDFSLVSRLIAKGYDIEQKFQGWSPLMKAAEENETRILQELLQQKADLEVKNRKGRTVLSFAACPSMRRNTTCDTLRMLWKITQILR